MNPIRQCRTRSNADLLIFVAVFWRSLLAWDKTILKIQTDPAFFNLYLSLAPLTCIGVAFRYRALLFVVCCYYSLFAIRIRNSLHSSIRPSAFRQRGLSLKESAHRPFLPSTHSWIGRRETGSWSQTPRYAMRIPLYRNRIIRVCAWLWANQFPFETQKRPSPLLSFKLRADTGLPGSEERRLNFN